VNIEEKLVKPGGRERIRDIVLTASEERFEVNIGLGKMMTRVYFDLKDAKRLSQSLEEWIQIANQVQAFRKSSKRAEELSKLQA
jgi:hypothetical protein